MGETIAAVAVRRLAVAPARVVESDLAVVVAGLWRARIARALASGLCERAMAESLTLFEGLALLIEVTELTSCTLATGPFSTRL